MKQYNQPAAPVTGTVRNKPQEPNPQVQVLQNQIATLQHTVALQSRQIRRLESAVQILESLVNSRLR